jgi:hypothetical protein
MAPERLSYLQRRILAWLVAEDQRTRGHHGRQPRGPGAGHGPRQGQPENQLQGPVTITPTPGGRAEAGYLTRERRNRVASLTASCE